MPHSRGRTRLRLGILLAIGMMTSGIGLLGFARSVPPVKDPAGIMVPSDRPFPDGKEVTLQQAEGQLSFPVLRPHDSVASDKTIQNVWVELSPGSQQAVLRYESGLFVYLELESFERTQASIRKLYRIIAGELGLSPTQAVQTVHGVTAIVIPADSDSRRSNLAAVRFSLGRVLVTVRGPQSLAVVLRVANSVR